MPNTMQYLASIAFLNFFYEKELINDAVYDKIAGNLQEALGINNTFKHLSE